MKKLKFNWKGLGAILMIVLGTIVIVHDFIKLLNGYSYSIIGLISIVLVIAMMDISVEYISDRLK